MVVGFITASISAESHDDSELVAERSASDELSLMTRGNAKDQSLSTKFLGIPVARSASWKDAGHLVGQKAQARSEYAVNRSHSTSGDKPALNASTPEPLKLKVGGPGVASS